MQDHIHVHMDFAWILISAGEDKLVLLSVDFAT